MAHKYSIASTTSALNSLFLSDNRAFRRSYSWELYLLTFAQAAPLRRLISAVRSVLALIAPRYTDSLVCLNRRTFPIHGPGTVKCTRHASLEDREERFDQGKLDVTLKPPQQGPVAFNDQGVPPICPNYFTVLLSYSHTSSSVSIY